MKKRGPSAQLREYQRKRDFSRTAEPSVSDAPNSGERDDNDEQMAFVVQKHQARRLHFDLRLELNGVMLSWAVTRGPSLDPKDKRLAVRTEDHPLAYADFEGQIPAGQYGAGTVMIWDTGYWTASTENMRDFPASGRLRFQLHGRRLRGDWLLVRMRAKSNEKAENWLLRKIKDSEARSDTPIIERELTSVTSGRSMAHIAAGADGSHTVPSSRSISRSVPASTGDSLSLPAFRPPQLASLAAEVPAGPEWMHEIKFDGYRAIIAVAGRQVRVFTRTGKDWSQRCRGLVEAIAQYDLPPCLLDGELVVLDSNGNPDFGALQSSLDVGNATTDASGQITFFAFDLLEVDGEDLSAVGNLERKQRMRDLLERSEVLHDDGAGLRLVEHVLGEGNELLRLMCAANQEGIISKHVNAGYRSRRTDRWRKVKCTRNDVFTVVGIASSASPARPFASLLVAAPTDRGFEYRGKVGSGFSAADMSMLGKRLERMIRITPPVAVPANEADKVRWVSPKLTIRVGYAEITNAGRLRHARYRGLALPGEQPRKTAENRTTRQRPRNSTSTVASSIKITHPDRIIFPKAGISKGGLARFYQSVARGLLPDLAARPMSLLRCPQGRAADCFYQRHHNPSFGEHVLSIAMPSRKGLEQYLYISGIEGVLACVQMGSIEFHPWACHSSSPDRPDRTHKLSDVDRRQRHSRGGPARSGPRLAPTQRFRQTLCHGISDERA